MAYSTPPDTGVSVSYLPTPNHSSYDVGGQQVDPMGFPLHGINDGPAPILNGMPQAHPIAHVAQLITDHANLLRQRLMAAHLQGGFAPEQTGLVNPLELVNQTRNPNYSHLAALMAKFQRPT